MEAGIGRFERSGDSLLIFFAGCDFACPNCNEPGLLQRTAEHLADTRDIKKEMLNVKKVVFTGGEPCLQRQALIQLASSAKDLGAKTILETNGSKTECIRTLLSQSLLDAVVLDIKSVFEEEHFQKATRSRTFFKSSSELINDVLSSVRLLRDAKVDVYIRTVITPTLLSRKEQMFSIAREIEDLDCVWLLSAFSPENVDHKMLKELRPPSREFLNNLAESLRNRHPQLRVTVQREPF